MKNKLNKYWSDYLLTLSETGMGYQKIEIELKTGEHINNIIVLNAEEFLLPENYNHLNLNSDNILSIKIKRD